MGSPSFVADAMLGRLARWLRVLGLDTTYEPSLDDSALVRLAARDDRVLLTRDRHLLRELRPTRALEIAFDAPLDQLRQVVTTLDVDRPREPFTRCLVCNTVLETVAESMPEWLADADRTDAPIPESAHGLPGPVRRCPGCGRWYWPGSHVRRMRRALDQALPGWLTPEGPGDSRR